MNEHFTIGQKLRIVRPIPVYSLKKDQEVELLKVQASNGIGTVYLVKSDTISHLLVRRDFEPVEEQDVANQL